MINMSEPEQPKTDTPPEAKPKPTRGRRKPDTKKKAPRAAPKEVKGPQPPPEHFYVVLVGGDVPVLYDFPDQATFEESWVKLHKEWAGSGVYIYGFMGHRVMGTTVQQSIGIQYFKGGPISSKVMTKAVVDDTGRAPMISVHEDMEEPEVMQDVVNEPTDYRPSLPAPPPFPLGETPPTQPTADEPPPPVNEEDFIPKDGYDGDNRQLPQNDMPPEHTDDADPRF
jgi:hypothetical protein